MHSDQYPTAPRAVVDIGSNSVRLVIYEGPPRCPVMVFNEKMLCGLGNRDRKTGELLPDAMAEALSTLGRFASILKEVRPMAVHAFATAAVREAPNGPSFLKEVRARGLDPRLLSGEEEAEMAALGILSGTPRIIREGDRALAGDIGGGSLELSVLSGAVDGFVADRVSLPLGALRLQSEWGDDRTGARKHIAATVEEVDWLPPLAGHGLYAVGGAWRALARIQMLHEQYPIDILDGYRLSRSGTERLCAVVSRQSVRSLEAIPGGQRRRAPTLPFAAMVLEAVMQRSGAEWFEISASGVREGVLFDAVDDDTKRIDPLLCMAQHAAQMHGAVIRPETEHVLARLDEILGPLDDAEARWLRAAAILMNVSTPLQPDARAHHATRLPVALPLRGISHVGRVYLAIALGTRHGADEDELSEWLPLRLLEPDDRSRARAAGLAMRFLASLAPGGGRVLENSRFNRKNEKLAFHLPSGMDHLWGPSPSKRLDRLAEALDLEAVLPV